mmetsp:Transcript_7300/g.15964  ORF Transcript_7300/g.15964 Transcript_7300/m.15964 type:complete len:343 (+) Transcript_7300:128-1156(+)
MRILLRRIVVLHRYIVVCVSVKRGVAAARSECGDGLTFRGTYFWMTTNECRKMVNFGIGRRRNLLLHLMNQPGLIYHRLHVDARRTTLQTQAAFDEGFRVQGLAAAQVRQHLEENLAVGNVESQGSQQTANPLVLHAGSELFPCYRARPVEVHLLAKAIELLCLQAVLPPLLHDEGVSILLGHFLGVIDEDTGQHIVHSELKEGHVEGQKEAVFATGLLQQVVESTPVLTAGAGHEERSHRPRHRPEELQQGSLELRLHYDALFLLFHKERGNGLNDDETEDHQDEGQHYQTPKKGQHGAPQGVEHGAELAEYTDDPENAKHPRDPGQPDRSHKGEVGLVVL